MSAACKKNSVKTADISCNDTVSVQTSGRTGQDDSVKQMTMPVLMLTATIRLQARLTKAAFEAKATEQTNKIIWLFSNRRTADVLKYP